MCIRTVASPAIYRGARLPTGFPTQLPLGAELIGNGGFADATVWTLGSVQWAIAAGLATRTVGGGTDQISQPVVVPRGKYARLSYDVSAITGTPATVFMQLLGSSVNVPAAGLNNSGSGSGVAGTFVVTVPVLQDTVTFRIRAVATAGLSIDNVSVRKRG